MTLLDAVTFGDSGLDRAARLRGDGATLDALARGPRAGVVALRSGEPLVEDGVGGPRLARLGPDDPLGAGGPVVFLGLDDEAGGEAGVWAAAAPEGAAPPEGRRWTDLRAVMTGLGARDAELAATAKAILGWHATHGFCAACGVRTIVAQAGWQRDCPACGAHHFPRTDPVVIMLVTRGNSLLVGRSPGWPEGVVSLLAGFVEPGETVEAAVRREVWEEAGVSVGAVSYLASQPWPWPASLMLGCRGEALTSAITLDPKELEAALWVSRERMARVVAGRDPEIRAPRAGAIAAHIVAGWLAGRLG